MTNHPLIHAFSSVKSTGMVCTETPKGIKKMHRGAWTFVKESICRPRQIALHFVPPLSTIPPAEVGLKP